jgi:gas vesicle protein
MNYGDFLLGLLSGAILGIISQITSYYFAKKNLKIQQEQNERILKTQLFHEDRKKAIIELDGILKKSYKSLREFSNAVASFLDGESGIFVPIKLRNELKGKLQEIWNYLDTKQIELYGEPPEEPPDDYEAWAEAFPEKALDAEITQRLSTLKSSMRDKIKEYVSEE